MAHWPMAKGRPYGSRSAQLFVAMATRFSMWSVTLVVTFPRYIMVGIQLLPSVGIEVSSEKLAM